MMWAQLRFPVAWTEGLDLAPAATRTRAPVRRPPPATRLDPVQGVIPVVRLWDGGGGTTARKCSPLKRARTINVSKLPLKQRQAAQSRSFWDVEVERLRPKTRAECIDGPRPCPWVGCRHHNAFTVDPERGSIKETFPQLGIYAEPDGDGLGVLEQLVGTCSLDIVDRYDDGTQGVGGLLALYQAANSGRPIGTTPGMAIEQTGKALNLSIERVRQLGSHAMQDVRIEIRRREL
jgi:hypothetical protein